MTELPVTPEQEKIIATNHNKNTSFSTDILKLVSGTTIAQALTVLSSPILARLFDPEAFGVFALFSSILGIIVAFFTLEYDLAIMLPKNDSDAANLFAGSLAISTLVSFLMVPVIWFGGTAIANWLNAPLLAQYLWMAPILLFFGGIGAGHPVLNAWASRTRHFSRISVTQVTGTITSTLGKLAFGIFGFNSGGGLIAGSLFGSVVSPLLLGWQIWKENYILFKQSIRLPIIWKNLKRYRKFAMYNTPSSLLNTLSWQVPSFLLAFFFSPIVVGYYAFGNQLLRLPMNLIGGSIAQAFYSHAATAHKDGKLAEFVEETFRRLVDYSFLPLLTLTFIGRELCVVVFGSEWAEAGVYIQILSVWTFFWFISGPMARLFNILEKNEFPFWMNIIQIVLRVIAIWLGGMMGSPRLSLLFFSIVGVVLAGYVSTTIILIAGVPGRKIGEIFLKNSLFLIPVGIILMTLKLLHISDWLQLAAATILVCVYYYRFVDEIKLRLMNISFFKNIIKTK